MPFLIENHQCAYQPLEIAVPDRLERTVHATASIRKLLEYLQFAEVL